MSRRLILSASLLIAASFSVQAQNYNFEKIDLKTVDKEELKERLRKKYESWDSLYYALKIDSLVLLDNYVSNRIGYTTIALHAGVAFVDYGNFSRDLAAMGFPTVNNVSIPAIGLGIVRRENRAIFEYKISMITGWTEEQDGKRVEVNGFSIINLTVGYDVVNSKKFQLYLMGSVSHLFTDIDLRSESTTLTSTSDLASVASQFYALSISRTSWRVGPAIELDYRFSHSKGRKGTVIGICFGLNYDLGNPRYRVAGTKVDYDPGVDLNKSYASIVFKPFQRY